MYCKKCNIDYDDDSLLCKKCGQKLIEFTHIIEPDELEEMDLFESEEVPEETQEVKVDEIINGTAPSLLITVLGKDEADYLVDLLEVNSIPALKKECEKAIKTSEDDSKYTYDIFVPHQLFPQALELVSSESYDDSEEDEFMDDEELDKLLVDMANEFENTEI